MTSKNAKIVPYFPRRITVAKAVEDTLIMVTTSRTSRRVGQVAAVSPLVGGDCIMKAHPNKVLDFGGDM